MARDAFNSAISIGSRDLTFEAVICLISRFSDALQRTERDRWIEEWQQQIESEGTPDQRGALRNSIAVFHLEKSEFTAALENVRAALEYSDKIVNMRLVTMLQINMGNCYNHLGVSDKAVTWLYRALENAEQLGDDGLCSYIHNNLGILHRVLPEQDIAIKEFEEVVRLAEKTGDEQTLANAYNNLCGAYFYLSKYDSAMSYVKKAEELYQKINDQSGLSSALNNIGSIFQKLDEFDEALIYFEKALNLAIALDKKHAVAVLLKNIADIHFEREEFDQVLPLYDRSLSIAKEIGALDMQNDLFDAYATFYEEKGDWKSAYNSLRTLLGIKELLFRGHQREVVEELRQEYESERKEHEAVLYRERSEMLEKEILERQKCEEDLRKALANLKVLTGLLPVCAHCRKVREQDGSWSQLETYISRHSDAQFSHGVCPDCVREHYQVAIAKDEGKGLRA